MYDFSNIDTVYRFNSSVLFPNGSRSELCKSERLQGRRINYNHYEISLIGATDVLLNGAPPDDFNEVMLTLGQSLYPIVLEVTETGFIEKVSNFEDIEKRWKASCSDIKNLYESSFVVEQYINSSSGNMRNKDAFLNALRRNAFLQLFFNDYEREDSRFIVPDFPMRKDKTLFSFNKREWQDREIIYSGQPEKSDKEAIVLGGNAVLKIRRAEDGIPRTARFMACVEVKEKGYFTKEIGIELIN